MSGPSMRPSSDPMESEVDRPVNWEHNGRSVSAISQCNGTVNQQTNSPLSHIASVFLQQISEPNLNIGSSVNVMGEREKEAI